jgi:hypothetical protein
VTGTPPTATPTLPARAFLPQVLRQPTPTPTATATPTVPPSAIVNPGFEQGQGVGWQEYSTHGWDLIMNGDFPGGVTPHGGQWLAWLGGEYDEISYVRQTMSIRTGASILSFWMWIASADVCGYDYGGVIVNSTVVDVFDLCSDTDTGGWVRRTVNLNAYAGQNVAVQIRSETDDSFNSNLFIDDVALGNAASEIARPAPPRPGLPPATIDKSVAGASRSAAVAAPEGRVWAPLPGPKE